MRVLRHPLQALKTIAIFAVAMSCTGCFWVPAETGVRMQADIRDLQNNMRAANKHMEQQAAHLEEHVDRPAVNLQVVVKDSDAVAILKVLRIVEPNRLEVRKLATLASHKLVAGAVAVQRVPGEPEPWGFR